VPKAAFSDKAVPKFPDAPAAILVTGDVEFFVEEAAARTREILAKGKEAEVLRFEDDAPAESVSDALLNRSLFSPQRIVELDISRLLGTEAPGRLLTKAVEAWEAGKRREAFKQARLLLAALDLPLGVPEETADAAARKVRRKDEAELFAEILKEMPEEKSGGAAVLRSALRSLLERTENDGTVALLTAVAPPAGVDLVREIADRGLVLETTVGDDAEPALRRLASTRAREREVVLDPGAVETLLVRTDSRAAPFAMELEKLLEWAGKGGRVKASDIESNVEDESSEDVYGIFDSIGRRDAGDALARLERLLDGREIRAGDREFRKIEDIWPIQLFGMIAGEVRRMLLIRARLDEAGGGGFDASMSYQTFQARVLPRLMAPSAPFGRSPFETAQGGAHPFGLYRSAQRSSKFTTPQLARALARAADVDVALKNSAPPLETLSVYVGDLVAGK
jgi:DNA polymerase III delta subunit